MTHPTPFRPEAHAVYDPVKMGKATLFQSERLLVGLNCFEPGQEHKLHAHAGMDKVYHVLEGEGLFLLEPAPRTVRGARDLLSVALQYGNAFLVGMQAAALKPADYFGNDDVLYLMEDMATGEIRLSILWEWLHKNASFTAGDESVGLQAGDTLSPKLCQQLLAEEYEKLRTAGNRDVHDSSKNTTLPIAREIVETYVMHDVKLPWYIDLLNINLENLDLAEAKRRIRLLAEAFRKDGKRITENLDF